MQATYSSLNKSILGTKAVILTFLFHFISPLLEKLSLPATSEHHSIVRGVIAVIVVALVEYAFLKCGQWLNSNAIKDKLSCINSQLKELEALSVDEGDKKVQAELGKAIQKLKTERVHLTAGQPPK